MGNAFQSLTMDTIPCLPHTYVLVTYKGGFELHKELCDGISE